MPKIVEKRTILNGRGSVVLYGSGSSAGSFFYRELIEGTKSYKTRKIMNVNNMEEAVLSAIEIAFKINSEPEISISLPTGDAKQKYVQLNKVDRRPRKQLIKEAIDKHIANEQRRVDAGLITQGYLNARTNGLRNHLLNYLETKLTFYTNEIKVGLFQDYPIHRAIATPIVRKQELKWIKEFCRDYLVVNKLMDSDVLLDKNFIPRILIRETDLMKNPAINEEDWERIVDFVRDEWRFRPLSQDNKCGWYFRNMFWHYILFSKNTGMSPEEVLKMKWRQIEIVDEKRINSKGEQVTWEVSYIRTIRSKTKKAREIPARQADELRRWKGWLTDYISGKGIQNPQSFTELLPITKDTYVYGQPDFNWKPFSYKHLSEMWREIRHELRDELVGHRFSPHPYTIYSMRSTFIEDHLLKGTPVLEVAEMAGHSVLETQKTYARLNLRRKGREITLPVMSKRLNQGEVVDLFSE